MNPCKVCSNDSLRSQVDRMISEGISDNMIVKGLESVGVKIGKTSILRHRQNHAPAPDTTSETPAAGTRLAPFGVLGDEPAALLRTVREAVKSADIDASDDKMIRDVLLGRILISHLAITSAALDRYMIGEGIYPHDMVKGLSTILTATRSIVLEHEMKVLPIEPEEVKARGLSEKDARFWREQVLMGLGGAPEPEKKGVSPEGIAALREAIQGAL